MFAQDGESDDGEDDEPGNVPVEATQEGLDRRGIEREVVAAVLSEFYLVIHVIPTARRR